MNKSAASCTKQYNFAVAVSLFKVNKPDASLVTKSDLLDKSVSQLIGTAYKKLSDNQQRWHTFETELYAIVLGCKNLVHS